MQRTVVITAGGTNEKIDEVRKITNMSTGELGFRICHELVEQKLDLINKIYYICPRNAKKPENLDRVELITANDTFETKREVENLLSNKKIDYFIHSMAVSDYTTDYVSNAQNLAGEIASVLSEMGKNVTEEELTEIIEKTIRNHSQVIDRSSKISSVQDNLLIKLKPTPKIISRIKEIQPETFLVGFKLLNGVSEEKLYNVAYALLQKNKCDMVVANDLANIRKGQHKAMFINPDQTKEYCYNKDQIAKQLVEHMFKHGENNLEMPMERLSNLESQVISTIHDNNELSIPDILEKLNSKNGTTTPYLINEIREAIFNIFDEGFLRLNKTGTHAEYSLTWEGLRYCDKVLGLKI